jgi:hemolysin activation/secretion protein
LLLPLVAQASSSDDCPVLSKVDIEANPLITEARQRELVAPYLGSCIDSDLIRQLLAAISNDFIENGYVTSRPYLQEQDVSDGQVEIRVLIGTVEAVIDAASGGRSGKISTAFLFSDEILNLRDLETSLEQIERVASVEASIEIRPGTQQGGSIVAIKTTESDSLRFEVGANAQSDLDNQLSFLTYCSCD